MCDAHAKLSREQIRKRRRGRIPVLVDDQDVEILFLGARDFKLHLLFPKILPNDRGNNSKRYDLNHCASAHKSVFAHVQQRVADTALPLANARQKLEQLHHAIARQTVLLRVRDCPSTFPGAKAACTVHTWHQDPRQALSHAALKS